jgi:hypothetical protein
MRSIVAGESAVVVNWRRRSRGLAVNLRSIRDLVFVVLASSFPSMRIMRYVWAGPSTAIGLVLAVLALYRGRIAVWDGVVEAHGPLLRWILTHLTLLPGGVSAITFGHAVLGRDAGALAQTRAHERVHVNQYERWGPFFLPAYAVASLWALARGGDAYFDNWFERQAR